MQASAILVAIDFQEASLAALALARELAEKLEREIVLLHVYVAPIIVYPGVDPVVLPGLSDEIAKAAKASIDALARECGAPKTLLRAGDPAREIVKVVEETRPAMLVMGTHGRRGLSHALLGSVAEKVVRQSSAPVLTVHAGASGP